jgi:hypothetical protein
MVIIMSILEDISSVLSFGRRSRRRRKRCKAHQRRSRRTGRCRNFRKKSGRRSRGKKRCKAHQKRSRRTGRCKNFRKKGGGRLSVRKTIAHVQDELSVKSQLNRCLEAANEQIAYAKLQGTYKQVKAPLTAAKEKCRADAKTAMRGVRERHAAIARAQRAQAAAAQPGQRIQEVRAQKRAEQQGRLNARLAQLALRGAPAPS